MDCVNSRWPTRLRYTTDQSRGTAARTASGSGFVRRTVRSEASNAGMPEGWRRWRRRKKDQKDRLGLQHCWKEGWEEEEEERGGRVRGEEGGPEGA